MSATQDLRAHLSPTKKEVNALKSSPQKQAGTPSPSKRTGRAENASPVRAQATPVKAKPWDKLWGLEYKMEEGRK